MIVSPARSRCRSPVRSTFTPKAASAIRKPAPSQKSCARGRKLKAQEYVADGRFESVIEKLFANRDVDYLQVNSTTAGCFTFRIERATNGE
jgi:hypothetical protein